MLHFARVALLASAFVSGCAQSREAISPTQTLSFRVVRSLPHDVADFTQGLALHDHALVESVGLYGRSALRVKDLETGRVLLNRAMSAAEFGEGVTFFDGRIYQLTWREGTVHVLTPALQPLAKMRIDGEGWGLTHDGTQLISSDGSARLRFRDPRDLRVLRSVEVRDAGRPVAMLNELEYARGLVFANVWTTDTIVAIDPRSGRVRYTLDLAPLKTLFDKPPGWSETAHVLNGIAWDAERDRFYVTGKNWPVLFELDVERP